MRIALAAAALLLACTSTKQSSKEPPAPAATAVAGSLPPGAKAPAPVQPRPAAPGATAAPAPAGAPVSQSSGPMTAADAARIESQRGSAGDGAADDSPCAGDADCAFTQLAPGACCPLLCTPRAVTRQRAAELDAHMRECSQGRACPLPACAPPRQQAYPACVQGRCVAQPRKTMD